MNDINEQTKVPFYMISPLQKLYQMEMEYEKDMERMKALYPRQVQQLLPVIEDYCDGLEYEGSRIYDENPDAQMMRRECEKLVCKIKEDGQPGADLNAQQIQASEEERASEAVQAAKAVQATEAVQAEAAAQAKPRRRAFSFTPPQGWELPPQTARLDSGSAKACIAERQSEPQLGMSEPQLVLPPSDWQDDLIGILFHNEIFRRRSRHRRCSRWW